MRNLAIVRLVNRSLRFVFAIGCLAAVMAPAKSLSAQPFVPYRARVVVPSAAVRSGPSEGFYPTDMLAEGDAVDVYRRDANGWCAIRPPDGSFSWVFGRHLRLLTGSDRDVPNQDDPHTTSVLGKIDKPDVASRIGSRMSNQRNAVQIRLKQGEVVRVIGEESSVGETWYKVSPPAGEFRWIHAGSIRRSGPVPRDEPNNSEPPQSPIRDTVQPVSSEAVMPEPADDASAETAATKPAGNEWHTASDSSALAATPNAGVADRSGETAPTTAEVNGQQQLAPITPIVESQPVGNVPGDLTRSLTELEMRLSRMVSEPPVAWNIEPLGAEAQTLLAQAQTFAERTAVQATKARIDRFTAIERRHRSVAGGPIAGRVVVDPGRGGGPLSPQTVSTPPYDAVGMLRPVVSRRPGAPPFALVDQRGTVVSFVTPTPGVDLQPFLGQWIGVAGNRGYIPDLRQAHVAAAHVAPLDARMIR